MKIFLILILASVPCFAKQEKMEKVPKTVFLIKKAKITSDVGEPQFYPGEAQLRTISNDKILQNTKKFE